MPIKKINALQNPDYVIQNKESEKEYIQALANLGQRIGIKGDSIKYSSFKLINIYEYIYGKNPNLLNLVNIKENINNYIGFLYYQTINNHNSCKLGIINIKNLYNSGGNIYNINNIGNGLNSVNILNSNNDSSVVIDKNNFEYIIDDNLFNRKFFENDFKIESVNFINNIEYYLNKSIIQVKDNKLYSLIFGKIIGSSDVEIIYDVYSLEDNEPIKSIRVFKNPDVDNNNQQFFLFDFDYDYEHINLPNERQPKLDIFTLTKLDLIENDNTSLYNGVIYSELNNYFSEKNLELVDDNEIIRLFNNITTNSNDTIFKYFYVVGNVTELYFDYNNEADQKASISRLELEKNEFYTDENKERNLSLIEIRFNYLNNDINTLFVNILEYYHNYYICKNKSILNLRLVQNLYEKLVYRNASNYIDNLELENFDMTNYKYVLYFPLDTQIDYICNKNNEFEIFYTDNIFINKLNLEDIILDGKIDNNLSIFNNILFSSNKFTQSIFEVYNILPVYNNLYPEYMQSISVNFKYSLPYIDINTTNWIINGQDTGLTSYLVNNNLQNILIIYTESYDSHTKKCKAQYLNNIHKTIEQYYNNDNLEAREFEISREFINGENLNMQEIKTLTFFTALPKIDKNSYIYNSELYENTIIVSISSLYKGNDQKYYINNNEGTEKYLVDLDDEFLMITLWKYNKENQDWEILKDLNTGEVLDLSKFLNLGLLKQRRLDGKNYIFKYLGILMNNLSYLNDYENNSKFMVLQKEYNKLILNPEDSSETRYENELSTLFRYHEGELMITNNLLESEIENCIIPDDKKFLTSNTPIIIEDPNEIININKSNIVINQYDNTTEHVSILDNAQSWQVEKLINDERTTYKSEFNSTKNIGDYIFGCNIPNINMGEVFLSNSQFINRVNFITLNKNPHKLFHTYIGSHYEYNKKDTFCIKSEKLNYNLGTNTMINKDDMNMFDIQPKFLLDFEEVDIHSSKLYSSSLYDYKEKVSDNITKYYKRLNISFIYNDDFNSDDFILNQENGTNSIDISELYNNNKYLGIKNENEYMNQGTKSTNYVFNNPITLTYNNENYFGNYIEFDIIKYLCDNFNLFLNDQNSDKVPLTEYQLITIENNDIITVDDNVFNNCEASRLIYNIMNSYSNCWVDKFYPDEQENNYKDINDLYKKIFIKKYNNYITLAINLHYLLDIKLNNIDGEETHLINFLFPIRLEKLEIKSNGKIYNKYTIVAE